jgi:mannose-1-phosphate guanylyltransferase
LDIGALIAFHREHRAEATIHLIRVADPSAFGVVETDDDGRVLRFVEKPPPGTEPSNEINAGTYVLEPSVLQRIPAGQKVSIERAIFPAIASAGSLYAVATDDYWIDTGNPLLYRRANIHLIDGTRDSHRCEGVHESADVDPTATVAGSVISEGASVGAGALITESVVLPGAVVGANAVVADSVVMGRIGDDARVRESVIGLHGVVEPGEVVSGQHRPPADAT